MTIVSAHRAWWKLSRACLFLSLILVVTSCANRPPVQDSTAGKPVRTAEQIVQEAVDSDLVAGAVLLVARNGIVETLSAFGHASEYDFDGTRLKNPVEMTTRHVFDIASLTKVFATTFGLMILVDRGDVNLDAPVHEFRGVSKDSITVRQLLTHTAGLTPWKPTYFHAKAPDEALEYIQSLSLDYPVGEKRHYSDLGFMLLGYLIETVSGATLDRFVETELYEALGLLRTGFVTRTGPGGPFVATSQGNPFERRMVEDPDFGYLIDEDPSSFTAWRQYTIVGEVNDGNSYYAHQGVAGHAGLFSSAGELNVLLTLLLGGGTFEGSQVISADVIREFLTADDTSNGLGWAMSTSVLPVDHMPDGAFGHTGFTGTYAFADPGRNLALILLTNRQNRGVDASGNYPSLSALRREVTTAVLESIPRIEN